MLVQSNCRTGLFNRRRAKRSKSVEKAVPAGPQTNASAHQVN